LPTCPAKAEVFTAVRVVSMADLPQRLLDGQEVLFAQHYENVDSFATPDFAAFDLFDHLPYGNANLRF
jgi:hypothetical protein